MAGTPEVRYVFGDCLTNQIIEEIRLTSVSFKDTLNSGEFRATFSLDQTGKANDALVTATTPGRFYVVVERDGIPVGDFIVWTRTYQSQAKVFNLYGIPWKDYTDCRIMDIDYDAVDIEQRNLFTDLYRFMQNDPNSLKVQLPPPFPTSVLKSLDVSADEYKTYRQVMNTIADASDGFDWAIRTVREDNYYRRWLEIGYPQLGALDDVGLPVFSYYDTQYGQGGNITNYWCNDSMGSGATNFYGIGSGEGTSMLVSKVTHANLLSSGFPRYDATVDRKDIFDQTMLNSVTYQQAQLYKAPQSIITAEVKGDVDPEFGAYATGDACLLDIKDPRFPNGFKKKTRVFGREYYPPEDANVEFVRLTFEGEEQG